MVCVADAPGMKRKAQGGRGIVAALSTGKIPRNAENNRNPGLKRREKSADADKPARPWLNIAQELNPPLRGEGG